MKKTRLKDLAKRIQLDYIAETEKGEYWDNYHSIRGVWRKYYYTTEAGRGTRRYYDTDYSRHKALKFFEIEYKTDNDAPRGGSLGNHIVLTTKGYRRRNALVKAVESKEAMLRLRDEILDKIDMYILSDQEMSEKKEKAKMIANIEHFKKIVGLPMDYEIPFGDLFWVVFKGEKAVKVQKIDRSMASSEEWRENQKNALLKDGGEIKTFRGIFTTRPRVKVESGRYNAFKL